MAIRLSGLNSGLDTDAIVQELVSAYSLKTEKYEKAQTKLTWKQDTWKSLNTKIYSLYTNVSNLRFSSAYNLRKTTVSDNTKATVTASSTAVTGTQKLNILQTAQASYITGGKIGEKLTEVTGDTLMSALGYEGGDTSITIRKSNGEEAAIKIKKTTKISDVIDQLSEAGYNASFDANNRRIFLSAKESGAKADFDLVGETEDARAAISTLGLNTAMVDEKGNFINGGEYYASAYEIYKKAAAAVDANGAAIYVKADGTVDLKKFIEDQKAIYKDYLKQSADKAATKEPHQEVIDDYNALQNRLKARTAFEEIYYSLTGSGVVGFSQSDLQEMIKSFEESGEAITTDSVKKYITEADEISFAEADAEKIAQVLNENADNMETVAAYTENNTDLLWKNAATLTQELDAMQSDYEAAQSAITSIDTELEALRKAREPYNGYGAMTEEDVVALIERAEEGHRIMTDAASKNGAAVKIVGQDAVIQLNGVEYTSDTNSFSINGLTINAQAVTGEGVENAISITTNVDTQGIYDKIKDFLTEYNNVINEMCKLYNAESASDYEPLTDEEKEAMSEEQIEKWENKIKDSLLRRDTTLNSVMSAMINSMAQTIEIDGQKLSLSTFGISTLGFLNAAENENYAYHINGDEDDENTSGKEDKLMKAIEENPEQLMEFMKQLTSNLYTAIDNKMKSTELSSAYKVYNDKEMDSQLADYAQMISKWEEKVADKEDYYYKKFTQMETALGNLQSQTSSISGLLGS